MTSVRITTLSGISHYLCGRYGFYKKLSALRVNEGDTGR